MKTVKEIFVAKPYLNNSLHMKEFDSKKKAIKYLEEFTEFKMPAVEWEMIGKLFVKEA